MSEGFHLSDSEPGLIRTEAKAPRAASAQLQQAAQADGLAPGEIISFDVKKAPGAAPKFAKALVAHDAPEAFHVLVCKANGGERPARKVAKSKAAKGVRKSLAAPAGAEAQRRPPSLVLWVGKEVNGELVSVTKLHSH